jgi:uncharacterized protein YndB with AHSA1/START domain
MDARQAIELGAREAQRVVELVPVDRDHLPPEEIVRWGGSDSAYRTKQWEQDLRVGGRWRATGLGADGVPFSVEGEFLELDPPRTTVQSWKPGWDEGLVSRVTYRLEPIASGTRVTVRHEGFGDRQGSCRSHSDGWSMVLDRLAGHVSPAADGGRDKYFICRLLAPRPTFAFDMNEAEVAVMQEHVGYWRTLMASGTALIFGPVADPKGLGAWDRACRRPDCGAGARGKRSRDPLGPRLQLRDPADDPGRRS